MNESNQPPDSSANPIDTIFTRFDNAVQQLKEKFVGVYNESVIEYNNVITEAEKYVEEINNLNAKIEKLYAEQDSLNDRIKRLTDENRENKSFEKDVANKKDLKESFDKEISKVKKKLHEVKEKYIRYRDLYNKEVSKGWENKFYTIQREFDKLTTTVQKYNVSLTDEKNREDHYIRYYVRDDASDDTPYWVVNTVHCAIVPYEECTRKQFTIPKKRVIDIEILLTNSTGMMLQVLFTTFGNFIIPEYHYDNDDFCITREIIDAIAIKRDHYLAILKDHPLHKQLDMLESIHTDGVYPPADVDVLKQNSINTLYDVLTYLPNVNHYESYVGIDKHSCDNYVQQAIDYLTNSGYIKRG